MRAAVVEFALGLAIEDRTVGLEPPQVPPGRLPRGRHRLGHVPVHERHDRAADVADAGVIVVGRLDLGERPLGGLAQAPGERGVRGVRGQVLHPDGHIGRRLRTEARPVGVAVPVALADLRVEPPARRQGGVARPVHRRRHGRQAAQPNVLLHRRDDARALAAQDGRLENERLAGFDPPGTVRHQAALGPVLAVGAGEDETHDVPARAEQPVGRIEHRRETPVARPRQAHVPVLRLDDRQRHGEFEVVGHLPPRLGSADVGLAARRLVGQVLQAPQQALVLRGPERAGTRHQEEHGQKDDLPRRIDRHADLNLDGPFAARLELPRQSPRRPVRVVDLAGRVHPAQPAVVDVSDERPRQADGHGLVGHANLQVAPPARGVADHEVARPHRGGTIVERGRHGLGPLGRGKLDARLKRHGRDDHLAAGARRVDAETRPRPQRRQRHAPLHPAGPGHHEPDRLGLARPRALSPVEHLAGTDLVGLQTHPQPQVRVGRQVHRRTHRVRVGAADGDDQPLARGLEGRDIVRRLPEPRHISLREIESRQRRPGRRRGRLRQDHQPRHQVRPPGRAHRGRPSVYARPTSRPETVDYPPVRIPRPPRLPKKPAVYRLARNRPGRPGGRVMALAVEH